MAVSISHCQGKGSLSHNNREFKFKNVDEKRTKDNIVYKQEDLGKAYENLFGAALQEFNSKQKRSDRKIENYYKHLFGEQGQKSVAVSSNGEKSFYETLVQIGDKDNNPVGSAAGEVAKQILDEYMKGFQERNPNFYVFNAVMHLDEATPHLHIDYIPVAESKRGLNLKNGMAMALEQMGHGKGQQAPNNWRLAERKILEDICRKYNVEISEPQKSRGTLSPDLYKAEKDAQRGEINWLRSERNKIDFERTKLSGQVKLLEEQKETLTDEIKGNSERIKKQADKFNENKEILAGIKARIQNLEQELAEKENFQLKFYESLDFVKQAETKKPSLTGKYAYSEEENKKLLQLAKQGELATKRYIAQLDKIKRLETENSNQSKEIKRLQAKVEQLTPKKETFEEKMGRANLRILFNDAIAANEDLVRQSLAEIARTKNIIKPKQRNWNQER